MEGQELPSGAATVKENMDINSSMNSTEPDSKFDECFKYSQMLLNASLNSQNDIIILAIDLDYHYLFFNEKHKATMKSYYDVDVENGMSLMDAISTDIDKVHAKLNYDKAMAGFSHSTIQEFGDAKSSVFESFYSPLYNEKKEIVGATAYARDITERVKKEHDLKMSEEENRLLNEAMNQGIALHDVIYDENGNAIDYRYVKVNDFYEKMTGLHREDLIGRRVSEVLPKTEKYWWDAFAEVAITRKPKRVINHSAELGKYYSISFYSPKPNQVAGIVDDVTDLIEVRNQLIESESRYKLLAEKSHTAIWEIDGQRNFLYVSPVVETLLGYSPDDMIGKMKYEDLYPMEDRDKSTERMFTFMNNPNSAEKLEQILITKEKKTIWVESYISPVLDHNGVIVKYRGSDKDITERRQHEDMIVYVNEHDHLTDLFNRRYFDRILDEIDRVENYPLSIIMGDLNGLKLINDAFGHAVGDVLLVEVSKILYTIFNPLGVVARLGGDEFGIILPRTSLDTANGFMIEAKKLIEKESVRGINRSISFGVACKMNLTPIEQTLVKAEDAMYANKLYETTSHRSDTIKTILQTLHEKNPREEAHSRRVSMICTEMGKVLGMSLDEQNLLNAISNLHDIGKIAMDETILNKPGKLDEQEWEIIKKHPDIGYRILSTSPEFADVAIDILSHHERFDGNGYPRGIKGNDIPLRARIIAIADAYDAMISLRTYRDPVSHKQAVQELIRCKNTQFDPELVDIFLRLPGIENL